jgi:hypothetical protein
MLERRLRRNPGWKQKGGGPDVAQGSMRAQSLEHAEDMVRHLIAETNRSHRGTSWRYELTSEVDNIEVASAGGTRTLRIHPCWLRYVDAQGEFQSCIADEIEAWYLLARLTGRAA